MLDHFNLPVANLERSAGFYRSVLKVFNLHFLLTDVDTMGFGRENWEFGIVETPGEITAIHFAFAADTRETVDRFFDAALEAGGSDNGAPGLRSEYGAGYYSAYILDFDGHNMEAVSRSPASI